MAAKTFEIIEPSKIQSFSIKVTEKIQDKYLLEFLRTSLENQFLELSKQAKFYYSFIPSSLTYEIICFDFINKQSIPEPFIFLAESQSTIKELFITQSYFCLFDKRQLILYKNIENILREDIQTYIEQLYKIKIDKVTVIDEKKLASIKNKFIYNKKKYTWNFYSIKQNNSFQIFLIYTLTMLLIFTILLYTVISSNQESISQNETLSFYEKGYKNLLLIHKEIDKRPIASAVELMNYLTTYNIVIEKISYKNSKLYMVLKDNDRKKLLDVIATYIKNLEVHSIEFDDVLNKYKMEIIFNVKK